MPKLPRSTSSATSSMASGTIPSRPAKPHPDRLKIMHLFPDRPLAPSHPVQAIQKEAPGPKQGSNLAVTSVGEADMKAVLDVQDERDVPLSQGRHPGRADELAI